MAEAGAFPQEGMELTHILVSRDTGRSRDFYVGVLGAELYRQYGSSVVLRLMGNWLLLVSHSFTIRVPDCRAAYRTLSDRGATFLTPPVDHGGEIRCFLRDPDGHLFELSQAT